MICSISNAFSKGVDFVRNRVPQLAPVDQIAKNVRKLALPVIGLLAAEVISGAEAGPWAACICIIACTGLIEAPPLYAGCLAACGVAATIPGP